MYHLPSSSILKSYVIYIWPLSDYWSLNVILFIVFWIEYTKKPFHIFLHVLSRLLSTLAINFWSNCSKQLSQGSPKPLNFSIVIFVFSQFFVTVYVSILELSSCFICLRYGSFLSFIELSTFFCYPILLSTSMFIKHRLYINIISDHTLVYHSTFNLLISNL